MNSAAPSGDAREIKDHPVFRATLAALREGPDEIYVLTDEDLQAIEFGLLQYRVDPKLPPVILALIALAAQLHREGAPTAGVRLLQLLANVRPKLTILRRARKSAKEIDRLLGASAKTAPKLGAKAPAGTSHPWAALAKNMTKKPE